MKICQWGKDGGPESKSWGFWLVEIKPLFSIVLLRFEDGARDAYHTHAFHAVSWLLSGKLHEERRDTGVTTIFTPSARPIVTARSHFHKVTSIGRTWALSLRGPWRNRWREYLPREGRHIILTHGRKVVS